MDSPVVSPHPTAAVPADASADCLFGLMRMDKALLALPVEAVREVIPGQRAYSPVPISARGLRGAVSLRGTTIPVLDLRETLGLDPLAPGSEHVVVIVRCQGRLIGLITDEVCGIARVPMLDVFALNFANTPAGEPLATHTFETGKEVATVLSADRIASLPNLPMVEERTTTQRAVALKATESVLLFTCGPSHLGVNATDVDATVSQVRIERNALTSGFCLGVIPHHGFEVPVVNTRAAIGLGFEKGTTQSDVIIIRFSSEAMLGFVINEVRDIARIAQSDVLPMPRLGGNAVTFFRGMLADAEGREHLLLDMDCIRADRTLATLAGLRKPKAALQRAPSLTSGAPSSGAPPTGGAATSFLTYLAGGEHATQLTQVSAILTYPENVAPLDRGGSGMLGLFTYRGQVVPLICLSTSMGRGCEIDRETARVLVVERNESILGFVVQALRSIEKASWHSPVSNTATADQNLFQSLVLVGTGEQRRMISHVDLQHEAARHHHAATQAALNADFAAENAA